MSFVSSIPAPIPSRAGNRTRPTPPISAPQRTIILRPPPSAALTQMRRLITAITTRNNRIAKFIFWQTFPILALECIGWTASPTERLTIIFVLPVRTVPQAIATASAGHTAAGVGATEGLLGAGGRGGAFFVGTVFAVLAAVTDEEPAYAGAGCATLETKTKDFLLSEFHKHFLLVICVWIYKILIYLFLFVLH